MSKNKSFKDTFNEWATQKIHAPRSSLWLFILFSLEIFLFLPLDPILALFCLEKPSRRIFSCLIASLASLFSAFIGYFVAIFLWNIIGPCILGKFVSYSFFEYLCGYYQKYQCLAVGLGAFLPLPFKSVVLTAGVCKISFLQFAIFIFTARLMRFTILSQLVVIFGSKLRVFMQKYLSHTVLGILIKCVLMAGVVWCIH